MTKYKLVIAGALAAVSVGSLAGSASATTPTKCSSGSTMSATSSLRVFQVTTKGKKGSSTQTAYSCAWNAKKPVKLITHKTNGATGFLSQLQDAQIGSDHWVAVNELLQVGPDNKNTLHVFSLPSGKQTFSWTSGLDEHVQYAVSKDGGLLVDHNDGAGELLAFDATGKHTLLTYASGAQPQDVTIAGNTAYWRLPDGPHSFKLTGAAK